MPLAGPRAHMMADDNGRAVSASAWIADMGTQGDYARRHVLDAPMLVWIRGAAFATRWMSAAARGAFAGCCAPKAFSRPAPRPPPATPPGATSGRWPRICPLPGLLRSGRHLSDPDRHRRDRGGDRRNGAGAAAQWHASDRQSQQLQHRRRLTRPRRGPRVRDRRLSARPPRTGQLAWLFGPQLTPALCLLHAVAGQRPATGPFRRTRAPPGGAPGRGDRYRRAPCFHIME